MPEQRAVVPAGTAGELLESYRAGDSFFSSATGCLHGVGASATVDRLDALSDVLAGAEKSTVAMGAIPFDTQHPAHLVVPETVRTGPPPLRATDGERSLRRLGGRWSLSPIPTAEEHVATVERALKRLADHEGDGLRKVVLARSLRLECSEDLDVPAVLANLVWRDPGGFAFAVNLPERPEGPRVLLGASPELLVSRNGRRVVSNPLAGSVRRGADPAQDRERASDLLASRKDRAEHAVVVEAVADTLGPYCRRLSVPDTPCLVKTGTMWHLSTRLRGELADRDTPVHELAGALHPTPAVCGTPTRQAREAIRELESFDRGFYTGAVGYSDAAGDGEWVVTIRCADIGRRSADLFAGGGIMPGSDPEAELSETSAKLRTLLLALGVERSAS